MKFLSQTHALDKLHRAKGAFAQRIRNEYEHRARSCATCSTPGACCLDAHFVNVHITRLEAVAINNVIAKMSDERRSTIIDRAEATIAKYDLASDGDSFSKTYACPLFEKGIGCLVHNDGKPLPCITHACYENREDLPPDELLAEQEALVEKINELTYRKPVRWLPLPVAIQRYAADRPLTSNAITSPASSQPTT